MALVPFAPPPGLNADLSDFECGQKWHTGNNVRFWRGKPQSIGGWVKLFATPLIGTPCAMVAFNRSGTYSIAYGTSSKLYVGVGAAQPTDRSPGGIGSSITSWSLHAWGSTLLASPSGGSLYSQDGTSTAAIVSAAPTVITCMLVTAERQVLALGCNEEISGTFNGLCIRGSDLEDYTNWTTTSSDNAFEHILDGVGQIVGARIVGSYVAVWTDTSLYLGQFIGEPGQAYRFDKVDDNCGLIGPNAVAVASGKAYWIAPDLQLRTWSPGALPETIPNKGGNLELLLYSDRASIMVSTLNQFSEIWIHYPQVTANDFYEAVSTLDGSWFSGHMTRTAWLDTGALASILGATYSSTTIAANPSGNVYVQEAGALADGAMLSWSVKTGYYSVNATNQRFMVKSLIYGTDDGTSRDVGMGLAALSHMGSDVTAKGIAIDAAKKDFRISGKLMSITFSSTASGAFMRLGVPLFDIVTLGER